METLTKIYFAVYNSKIMDEYLDTDFVFLILFMIYKIILKLRTIQGDVMGVGSPGKVRMEMMQ